MKKLGFLIITLGFTILTTTMCKKDAKDTTAPIITLKGSSQQFVAKDSIYIEPGFTAIDDVDGDITNLVKTQDNIDIHTEGTYQKTYNVTDASGNPALEQTREIKVMVF